MDGAFQTDLFFCRHSQCLYFGFLRMCTRMPNYLKPVGIYLIRLGFLNFAVFLNALLSKRPFRETSLPNKPQIRSRKLESMGLDRRCFVLKNMWKEQFVGHHNGCLVFAYFSVERYRTKMEGERKMHLTAVTLRK